MILKSSKKSKNNGVAMVWAILVFSILSVGILLFSSIVVEHIQISERYCERISSDEKK